MKAHDLQDWRKYVSRIDWSDMYHSAKMAKAQSGVVDRARQKGVELSGPTSDKSPGGWPQDFVTKNADGTPVYLSTLFSVETLIEMLRTGRSYPDIARRLGVSLSTVKVAVRRLRDAQQAKKAGAA